MQLEADEKRFAFGANWKRFADIALSEQRIKIAEDHFAEFFGNRDLSAIRMIDIGCGSGIHSLAAIRLGVKELLSFDYDSISVETTREIARHEGGKNWTVQQGSVLDREYMNTLGQFDLVYSWGVLHHTGDLWTAFSNAASLVAPGGKFVVALYASEVADPSPEFWLDVKRRYVAGNMLTKRLIEAWYVQRHLVGLVCSRINPISYIWNYKRNRGMSYMTDVRDWVGGWPMQFCSTREVTKRAASLGLEPIKIREGEANTEYLFERVEKSA